MFSAGLITFRETFEIVLILGIILTTLARTNQFSLNKRVWQGVGVGLALSFFAGYLIRTLLGEFTGTSEKIFEGVLLFVTAGFLTWMILWVHRQEGTEKAMREEVTRHATQGFGVGIFFLSLVSVLREGVEAALYLQATDISGNANILVGACAGILLALCFAYILFFSTMKISLSVVFSTINVLLILFAAGLVAHGVHEFQEAGLLPLFAFDPLFDISHLVNEKGVVGGFLHTLFGYSSTPSMLEVMSYAGYLLFIFRTKKL